MLSSILNIQVTNLGASLSILVQGMLGIFIFMGIFYLLIHFLDKIFSPKDSQ